MADSMLASISKAIRGCWCLIYTVYIYCNNNKNNNSKIVILVVIILICTYIYIWLNGCCGKLLFDVCCGSCSCLHLALSFVLHPFLPSSSLCFSFRFFSSFFVFPLHVSHMICRYGFGPASASLVRNSKDQKLRQRSQLSMQSRFMLDPRGCSAATVAADDKASQLLQAEWMAK